MRIWPRRRAKRAVFIAGESFIGPITIANREVARNGSDAIAIVVPKKIAGDGELRSRCVSSGAEGLCGPGGGVDHDGDSWPQARTGPSDPGSIADGLAHVEALAPVVAG